MTTKNAKLEPYVLLFTTRGHEGVPPSLESAPCYLSRPEYQHVAQKLHAMPEAPITEEEAGQMLRALQKFNGTIAGNEVLSDEEVLDSDHHGTGTAYFSGISMGDAKAALVAGGAIVDEYDSVPDAIERKNLLRLERHLDLTSLKAILASIAEDDDLPSHAETARALVSYALHTIATGSRSKAALAKEYLAMVCAAAPGWSAHRRDMLCLVIARAAHGEKGKQQAALLELLERVPTPESPQVRAQIERWVPQKAAGKRAPAGAARPKLLVEKATRKLLGDGFEAAANGLSAHFDLKDWPRKAPSESAPSIAKAAAEALEGVVLSSDTDCPYVPIVLDGPDPATQGFVDALGVEPSAIDVVASGKAARGFGALTLLSASELENADDYLSTAEQKALSSAAKVLGGTVSGVRLRTDDGSRVLLALGKPSEGGYPGVLAVSIET